LHDTIDNDTDGLTFNSEYGVKTSWYNINTKNLTIVSFANIPLSRGGNQFNGLNDLTFTASDSPIILNNTSLAYCFSNCTNFNSNLNNWDTSNVTNMNSMFNSATNFNSNLNNWDTSNVTNMNSMFNTATNFNNGDTDNSGNTANNGNYPLHFNTSKVTNMGSMFYFALAFNQSISYDSINNYWDTSNVIYMDAMFYVAEIFNNGETADTRSNPLHFNTSKVTSMYQMFYNATAFNQTISYDSTNHYWDTSAVLYLEGMFTYAELFNNGDILGGNSKPLRWVINESIRKSDDLTYYDIAFRTGSRLTPENGKDQTGIRIGKDY